MPNNKKAIVFDLDETLETATFENNNMIMTLRPNLDILIAKLNEAKSQGIDILLCSSATNTWINRFLSLKPEFKDIFDKIYCMNNFNEWYFVDEEKYPVEANARKTDEYKKCKPITTFGYDSILFIDDNKLEYEGLKKLFETDTLQKDVTYFSGFGFNLPEIELIFRFLNYSKKNPKFNEYFAQYLKLLRSENATSFISLAIDDFIGKEFKPGLNNIEEKYIELYREYFSKIYKDAQVLKELCKEDYTKEEYTSFIQNFFKNDKHYPYENIEECTKEPNEPDIK